MRKRAVRPGQIGSGTAECPADSRAGVKLGCVDNRKAGVVWIDENGHFGGSHDKGADSLALEGLHDPDHIHPRNFLRVTMNQLPVHHGEDQFPIIDGGKDRVDTGALEKPVDPNPFFSTAAGAKKGDDANSIHFQFLRRLIYYAEKRDANSLSNLIGHDVQGTRIKEKGLRSFLNQAPSQRLQLGGEVCPVAVLPQSRQVVVIESADAQEGRMRRAAQTPNFAVKQALVNCGCFRTQSAEEAEAFHDVFTSFFSFDTGAKPTQRVVRFFNDAEKTAITIFTTSEITHSGVLIISLLMAALAKTSNPPSATFAIEIRIRHPDQLYLADPILRA